MIHKMKSLMTGVGLLLAGALPTAIAGGWSYTESGGTYYTEVTVPACQCDQVLVVYGQNGAGSNHGPLAYWDKPGGYSNHVSGNIDAGTYPVYLAILSDAYGSGGQSTTVFSW